VPFVLLKPTGPRRIGTYDLYQNPHLGLNQKMQTHFTGLLARGRNSGLTIPWDPPTSVVEGPGAVLKKEGLKCTYVRYSYSYCRYNKWNVDNPDFLHGYDVTVWL
jgi:hypothetical protein